MALCGLASHFLQNNTCYSEVHISTRTSHSSPVIKPNKCGIYYFSPCSWMDAPVHKIQSWFKMCPKSLKQKQTQQFFLNLITDGTDTYHCRSMIFLKMLTIYRQFHPVFCQSARVFCMSSQFPEWNLLLQTFPYNCNFFYSLLQVQETFIRSLNVLFGSVHSVIYHRKWSDIPMESKEL